MKRVSVLAIVALSAGLTSGAGAAGAAAPRLVRVGQAATVPAASMTIAAVPSRRPMRITIALEPRHAAALARLAQAVSEPGSSNFRSYLSPAQFAARFAPGATEVRAVQAALRARGLEPGRVSANGLSISVDSTAGVVQRAFATALTDVRLPHAGEATIDSAAPAFDASVAGDVQAVIGLTSLNHLSSDRVSSAPSSGAALARGARASAQIATGGPQPCRTAAANAPQQSAYTSDQIATAYGFSGVYQAGDEGAGVTIGVYELEPDDPTDIATYQKCYGTHTQISYVEVDGGVHSGPGSGESALDIEQLVSLAPKAKLIVYQAPNSNSNGPGAGPYDLLSTIVSQDAVSVVSDSWGQCEPEEGHADAAAESVLFEEAAVQGQTVLASAGDSGSEDCDAGGEGSGNTSLEVDDPASQPFVTGVGGTTLTAIGPPPTETAWNSEGQTDSVLGGAGAGGGGVSSFWPMPSYQSATAPALAVTSSLSSGAPCHAVTGDCREVPDVSADADPNYGYLIYYNGSGASSESPSGWQGTGGTSAASPLWAALIALADANPACHGLSVGFANPTLYALAGQSPGTYFHEVTSGNNDLTGTAGGLYPATAGYSMATGLGTPDAAALVPALCADTLELAGPKSEQTFAHAAVKVGVRSSVPAGTTVTYTVHGLPRGLRFDPATGEISGKTRHAGRYRVRIQATDAAGGDRVVRFRWTVAARPRVSGATLLDTAGQPSVALTLRSGTDESGLRTLSLRLPGDLRFARSLAELSVLSADGKLLAHTASVAHGTLQVRLRSASKQIRLVLADGTLRGTGALAGQAPHRVSRLVVTVSSTDADGASATVKALLHANLTG
jgi:subtilase family serine protease